MVWLAKNDSLSSANIEFERICGQSNVVVLQTPARGAAHTVCARLNAWQSRSEEISCDAEIVLVLSKSAVSRKHMEPKNRGFTGIAG